MNKLPNGGKVVIVDDCFHEILPLINILNTHAVPVMYFTGKWNELPENPLQGVRVFFLDLRFSTNINSKNIVSNACNILRTILGEENGPYLLIIWSSTKDEYKKELEKELEKEKFRPEFILCLSKADYFQTKERDDSLENGIKKILEDNSVENADDITEKIMLRITADKDEIEKIFIPDKMEDLREELHDKLKHAGLLSLFILWENTIRNSAYKVVNKIFSQIPEVIPTDKKLSAMAYYLAKNRLEKQFENTQEEDKLKAALMELNELYVHFYNKDTISIPVDGFLPLSIQKNTELVPSQAKFNSWKMISPIYKKEDPGNIYVDSGKTFDFFDMTKSDTGSKLKEDPRILYIAANINGECETAQNKYYVIRVIPGILIPCDVYEEYEQKNELKALRNKAPGYIFKEFDSVEHNGREYYMLFNLNQSTFWNKDAINGIKVHFTLHKKYYLKLRQALAADLSKQGLDLYGSR